MELKSFVEFWQRSNVTSLSLYRWATWDGSVESLSRFFALLAHLQHLYVYSVFPPTELMLALFMPAGETSELTGKNPLPICPHLETLHLSGFNLDELKSELIESDFDWRFAARTISLLKLTNCKSKFSLTEIQEEMSRVAPKLVVCHVPIEGFKRSEDRVFSSHR
jgi:hypothetical protein